MNRPASPNFVFAVLVGFGILALAVLPIRVEFGPGPVAAHDMSTSTQPVKTAAGAESRVVEYTLRTALGGDPPMAYVGVGGEIDGVVNPELIVTMGDTVRITVINGDAVWHDLKIDAFGADTGQLLEAEQTATVEFVASQAGSFEYHCSVPGHREVGMKGVLRVVSAVAGGEADAHSGAGYSNDVHTLISAAAEAGPAVADAVPIVRSPADVPPPVGDRGPVHHVVELTAIEVDGILADGTTYRYMTFDGTVPGPMLRMRVDDTMELRLHNAASSLLPHSIDLHAVTGPGGGAVFTQTTAGETTAFTFRALQPGLYVYHCATASVPHHIASGMYGLILVEPVGGLPRVDREFYVMQGEIYTTQPFGTKGHLDFSYQAMLNERPEYFVFNGAAAALAADEYALRAEVGETVRIFFGVGGPNFTSSFHVIGEIFDRVYDQASITAAPLTDVQTTLVPPGGATMVEFRLDVPGRYVLVDHALSRLERGLVGVLHAEGEDNPDIFHGEGVPDMSGH